jgi:DNA-binding transcriptional MerR regulator
MNRDEIKKTVLESLQKGISLSEIQKILHEKGEIITFLDLRLLASELENLDWKKLGAEKEAQEKEAAAAKKKDEDDESAEEKTDEIPADKGEWSGATVVEVSKLVRPGAALSGSVKFASGVKADWVLDQTGRLGLEKPTGKPTPEDVKEFQVELQKKLQGM